MTDWFVINISSIEIPEGFPAFYFGALKGKVRYFKARNRNKVTFERLLHDRLAAELLRNNRPSYNLLFIVSTPINILDGVDSSEQSITPFVHYLEQEIEKLAEFIGVVPLNILMAQVDEHFETLSNFKPSKDKSLNNIHDLDHLKKNTTDYKLGTTWNKTLLEILAGNVVQSNLEYVLNIIPFVYFRVPFKGKNRMDTLHQLFSFFQLITYEEIGLNNTTLRKGRFQELSFTGNDIKVEISGLMEQVSESLNGLKLSIEKKELSTTLNVMKENEDSIRDEMEKMKALIDAWKPDRNGITCASAVGQFKGWKQSFSGYLDDLNTGTEQFLNFLNNKSDVIKVTHEEKIGALPFWQVEQSKLSRDRKTKKGEIDAYIFNPSTLLEDLEQEVQKGFDQIEKDLSRCPSIAFLVFILLISMLFYGVAISTVFNDFYGQWTFIAMTVIYILASIALFNHYRNKSVRNIKAGLKKIQRIIKEKGAKFLQLIEEKKSNQVRIYDLNNINQNFHLIEDVIKEYRSMEQQISQLQGTSTDISTISQKGGVFKDYYFKDKIKHTPSSLSDYLEIYNKEKKDQKIELEKDKSPQGTIDLLSLKMNAINKIMITTTKQ